MLNKMSKKKIIIFLIGLVVIIIGIVLLLFKKNASNSVEKIEKLDTINYNYVKKIIEDKDDILIYYYNSKSNNLNNQTVKEYLDKEGLRYYSYDDINVDKSEYKMLLELLEIDQDLFGTPALIYIRDGEMYANLINIDKIETVKQFIDDYDLFTVK